MRKDIINVNCKGCDRKTTTTIRNNKDNFYCTSCREKPSNAVASDQPEPTLFKKISDKMVKWFGKK